MKNKLLRLGTLFLVLVLSFSFSLKAQQNPPRVVFQAFWWNYENYNYPNGWYNYLAELAPRLKSYGIDAIWIPPSTKGSGTGDVGYTPFDHYDLGDKYQKGNVKTRLGTKDEYLRMVAVMHANGIDVIQDIVLNHMSNAGSANGSGGQDPNAPDDKWKNFRYTSYSYPAIDESVNDYLNRNGRWPKDYQNFHKSGDNSWGHNDYNYPFHSGGFGQDICYKEDAINTNGIMMSPADYGISSIFNPAQSSDYMKQQAIQWGVWLKKQTGIDGVRLDAAKHVDYDETKFPMWDVVQSFLWNLQHGTGLYGSKNSWADGTDNMFAISEYIPEGGQPSMEQFIDGIQDRSGTYDFNLRQGIYDMINQNGFYDISQVPGLQIGQGVPPGQPNVYRQRSLSFVNTHDSFRPTFDANGNYNGWDLANETPHHIDPFSDYLPAAYAISSAVDGSPLVFFEDLFNIGGTGKRYTHLPTSSVDLPSRDKIANIIWARRALNFAGGGYKVRSAEAGAVFDGGITDKQDLLIIERSAKAVIGVNDNTVNWKGCWIDTDFSPGTTVKDYSGANGMWTYTVDATKRVHINAPPANAQYGGYCIIAPVGFDGTTFNPLPRTTTQEWEMADDLGDSHSLSLKQGGAVPDFGIWINPRTVGRIFCENNTNIHLDLYPTVTGKLAPQIGLELYDQDGTTLLQSTVGSGIISLDYQTSSTNYYTIRIYNAQQNSKGQNVFVKATYTAPQIVNTSLYNLGGGSSSAQSTSAPSLETSISAYPNPSTTSATITYSVAKDMNIELSIYDSNSKEALATVVESGFVKQGVYTREFNSASYKQGVYILRFKTDDGIKYCRLSIGM